MSRIMVVDDEPDIRELVRVNLESAGHTVIPVESGTKCLDIVEDEKPDLILMDILMPKIDGWETIEEMRKRGLGREIPIVALTVLELSLVRMVRKDIEGLIGYIEKPFTKSELVGTVNEIIERIGEIKKKKAKIERIVEHGDSLARSYEDAVRKQMLHGRLLRKLEEMEGEMPPSKELAQIEDLVESERMALKMLELRKKVIERMAEIK